jgi:hypothetical protein
METLPEIVPLNREFHTDAGDWTVTALEEPREFAHGTCVHYKFRFVRPPREGDEGDERIIIVLVPKDELTREHREEELRHNIRAELDYSNEPEAMLNPYGCPLE